MKNSNYVKLESGVTYYIGVHHKKAKSKLIGFKFSKETLPIILFSFYYLIYVFSCMLFLPSFFTCLLI